MDLFGKVVNGWKPLTNSIKSSILDDWLSSDCTSNTFLKKSLLTGVHKNIELQFLTVICHLRLVSSRSSHQRCSLTLLKKKLWHRCFSVNFAKFLRKPFIQDTSGRLLLLLGILWTVQNNWLVFQDTREKFIQILHSTNELVLEKSLTHFRHMFYFNAPWKHQKISGFLFFPGGIKKEHSPEIV